MEELYDKHFVKNWLKAKDKALQEEHDTLNGIVKRPPRKKKVKPFVSSNLKEGIL